MQKQKEFPQFNLKRLLTTIFKPRKGEKVCILIDLDQPSDIQDLLFLKNPNLPVQKKAYDVFYQGIQKEAQALGLAACDLFGYEMTGGSNLELPKTAMTPNGKIISFAEDIYPKYDIILCISSFSATAPLTAAAKKFGFRGATMHGVNDIILKSGLAVDYNQVSNETEKLRQGMTHAEYVDVELMFEKKKYHLHIDLGKQDAQKSHGICNEADIVNLPAGEVYFVPVNAEGQFPVKFDEKTIGLMHVENGKIKQVTLLRGEQSIIDEYNRKFHSDPAAGILGELGFGTQVLPYANSDIQDEKIFGTFHLATGRNDHLHGNVTLNRFHNKKNATHDDILFSSTKTPEITVKKVSMQKDGKSIVLIENYVPSEYLCGLI